MSFKVVNVFGAPSFSFKKAEEVLLREGGESVIVFTRDESKMAEVAADADGIIGVFTDGIQTLSGKTIEKMGKLKIIAGIGIGYEGIDIEVATARGICVSSVPDYCLEEMANHTMMLLLALSKKLSPTMEAVRAGKWDAPGAHTVRAKVLPPLFRLSGQTLGLIGFGNIPRTVVPRAKAFGLRLIGYDPYVPAEVMKQQGVEPVDMETVLRQSDYVSLHAALTKENRHMMGLEQFKKMRRTAYFINTARGGLVDEGALYTALKEGIIAGAGIDVMDPEPPRADNPLLGLSNLIITPHVGQYSEESEAELLRKPYEEVVRVVKGGWPRDIAFRNPQVKEKFLARWGKK
ncbi:MAG: C-terminal binding protein [Chloroflexota bacterium]